MLYLAFRHPNARQLDPQETVYQAQSRLWGRGPEERVYTELVPQHCQAAQSSIWDLRPGEFLDPFPSTLKTNQSNKFSQGTAFCRWNCLR